MWPTKFVSYDETRFALAYLIQILYIYFTRRSTDARLTADPGVTSLIPAWSHTLVEIDHELISTAILLPSPESFKKGCCQLQAKVFVQSTG